MNPSDTTRTAAVACEWVRENTPAHALGTLEQSEANQLEQHVLTCRECDYQLSDLRRLIPVLALDVPQYSPADAVWTNILAGIKPTGAAVPPVARRVAITSGARTPRNAGTWWKRAPVITLPLLALLLVFGALAFNTQRKLDNQSNQLTLLERENAAMATHLGSIKAGEEAYGENTSIYSLLNVDASSGEAGGIMLGDPNQSTALLSVWNMPGNGVSYHVMCESELGELLSAGVLSVDKNGVGSIQLILPLPVTSYRAVHIVTTGGEVPQSADVPKNDILQVQLVDSTAVPGTD